MIRRIIKRPCPDCWGTKVNTNASGPCATCAGTGTIEQEVEER
jgi:DnaJ-class molecular chaperone